MAYFLSGAHNHSHYSGTHGLGRVNADLSRRIDCPFYCSNATASDVTTDLICPVHGPSCDVPDGKKGINYGASIWVRSARQSE